MTDHLKEPEMTTLLEQPKTEPMRPAAPAPSRTRRVLSDDIAQANSLADLLAAYYAQEGNWFGVEEWLSDASTRTASEGL